jgi:hypothetical protein
MEHTGFSSAGFIGGGINKNTTRPVFFPTNSSTNAQNPVSPPRGSVGALTGFWGFQEIFDSIKLATGQGSSRAMAVRNEA